MPTTKARGAFKNLSAKEMRQYEHIKASAKSEGRYGKRAGEVAARTLLNNTAKSNMRKAGNISHTSPWLEAVPKYEMHPLSTHMGKMAASCADRASHYHLLSD